MTEKLKECPFCGSDAAICKDYCRAFKREKFYISCTRCTCDKGKHAYGDGEAGGTEYGHAYDDAEEATRQWNTRSNKSPSPDAERLAKALREASDFLSMIYFPSVAQSFEAKEILKKISKALADFEKGGLK